MTFYESINFGALLAMKVNKRIRLTALTVLAWAICFFALPLPGGAAETLIIDQHFSKSTLKGILQVCIDPTNSLTIDRISSPAYSACFTDIAKEHPSFGYSKSTLWFRINVRNALEYSRFLYLEYEYSVIDEIDAYLPAESGFKIYQSGDRRPFHLRPISYRTMVFPITMNPETTSTFYLRIKSGGSLTIPLTVWSEDAFNSHREHSLNGLWFFYGVMAAIIFYNLLIFVSFREISYLFLTLFAINMTLYAFTNNGMAFQYLWPNSTDWANTAHPFFLFLSCIWATLFTRFFLNMKDEHPRHDLLLKVVTIMGAVLLITPFMLPYKFVTQISMIHGLLAIVTSLEAGIYMTTHGSRPARFLMAAWIVFLLSMGAEVMRAYGIIPKISISDGSLNIGTCSMVLLLSLGITDKINMIRREKDRVQAALAESEERYRDIFNNVSDVLYVHDLEGRFIDINRQVEKLGYRVEEMKGTWIGDLIPEVHRNGFFDYLKKIKLNGSGTGLLSIMAKDRSIRTMEFINSAIYDQIGRLTAVRGSVRDVTDRIMESKEKKDLQAKLLRSKKMEALGMLAGGVAHDLNNILTAVVSYPELLLMNQKLDEGQRRIIETIRQGGIRAAAIVNDLLTIARGVAIKKETIDLSHIVREYLTSPEYLALKERFPHIGLTLQISDQPLKIDGSSTHLRKTLMNLVVNAFEAVDGEQGKITIYTGLENFKKESKEEEDSAIMQYIVLAVADNGHGIAESDQERIFEPFYSKKIMGYSGSGLGLAVVWNTVQDHNGFIELKSGDTGTIFRLCFPVSSQLRIMKHAENTASEFEGKGQSILIVDDDPIQREIASSLLEAINYKVNTASSGENALEFIKSRSVDLVILDMIMDPGINGRETYRRMIEINPRQKALIVSGYAADDEVKTTQAMGAGEFISKPYSLEKLGLAVKKAINAS